LYKSSYISGNVWGGMHTLSSIEHKVIVKIYFIISLTLLFIPYI